MMKRFFTLAALAMAAISAAAKDYTDRLEVSIIGEGTTQTTSQTASVDLTQGPDGKYSLTLKNFVFSLQGNQIGVGTILIDRVDAVDHQGVTTLMADSSILIKEGEGTSPSGIWMGPSLGNVPVQLMAELRGDALYTVINIDMQQTLGQNIQVVFGNGGYQIPNSGFEQFHKEKKVDEPNHWHSFASSDGVFSPFVSTIAHTFVSDVVRPGTSGSHSVMLTSARIFGLTANGTLTTGRMVAASSKAEDPANHAEMDMSNTAKDANGNPFHVQINGRPEAISAWVKFKQATPQPAAPYATISATITDGSYYQEPEDKAYTNVMSRAKNDKIETKGFEWQNIMIPFETVDKNVDGKAILVTISTNALPGKGSIDTLYIDDLSLVYNQDIVVQSISVKNNVLTLKDNMEYRGGDNEIYAANDIAVDTKASKVIKRIEETTGGIRAVITVASEDLKTFKTYTIDIPKGQTGITAPTGTDASAPTVYDLQGRPVDHMKQGQVYILKTKDKTTKLLNKK